MYEIEMLLTGYPGTTTWHGGLGWATVGLLRDENRVVLVDTGGPNLREPLLQALDERGLGAHDVTDVLITHCHWDHLGNVNLFPHARLVVPGAELWWARRQQPGTWHLADLHVDWLTRQGSRVAEVDDGDEVLPGVRVVATPGHTPGHCAYEVAGGPATALFAGDAVKNRAELLTGDVQLTLDAHASRASVERVRARLSEDAAVSLVPGHDVRMRMAGDGLLFDGAPRARVTALLGPDGHPVDFDLVRSRAVC